MLTIEKALDVGYEQAFFVTTILALQSVSERQILKSLAEILSAIL